MGYLSISAAQVLRSSIFAQKWSADIWLRLTADGSAPLSSSRPTCSHGSDGRQGTLEKKLKHRLSIRTIARVLPVCASEGLGGAHHGGLAVLGGVEQRREHPFVDVVELRRPNPVSRRPGRGGRGGRSVACCAHVGAGLEQQRSDLDVPVHRSPVQRGVELALDAEVRVVDSRALCDARSDRLRQCVAASMAEPVWSCAGVGRQGSATGSAFNSFWRGGLGGADPPAPTLHKLPAANHSTRWEETHRLPPALPSPPSHAATPTGSASQVELADTHLDVLLRRGLAQGDQVALGDLDLGPDCLDCHLAVGRDQPEREQQRGHQLERRHHEGGKRAGGKAYPLDMASKNRNPRNKLWLCVRLY